jgi:hypothetical protein
VSENKHIARAVFFTTSSSSYLTTKKNEEETKSRPPFHPLARVCRPPARLTSSRASHDSALTPRLYRNPQPFFPFHPRRPLIPPRLPSPPISRLPPPLASPPLPATALSSSSPPHTLPLDHGRSSGPRTNGVSLHRPHPLRAPARHCSRAEELQDASLCWLASLRNRNARRPRSPPVLPLPQVSYLQALSQMSTRSNRGRLTAAIPASLRQRPATPQSSPRSNRGQLAVAIPSPCRRRHPCLSDPRRCHRLRDPNLRANVSAFKSPRRRRHPRLPAGPHRPRVDDDGPP